MLNLLSKFYSPLGRSLSLADMYGWLFTAIVECLVWGQIYRSTQCLHIQRVLYSVLHTHVDNSHCHFNSNYCVLTRHWATNRVQVLNVGLRTKHA
jgi:hypothetical protein